MSSANPSPKWSIFFSTAPTTLTPGEKKTEQKNNLKKTQTACALDLWIFSTGKYLLITILPTQNPTFHGHIFLVQQKLETTHFWFNKKQKHNSEGPETFHFFEGTHLFLQHLHGFLPASRYWGLWKRWDMRRSGPHWWIMWFSMYSIGKLGMLNVYSIGQEIMY